MDKFEIIANLLEKQKEMIEGTEKIEVDENSEPFSWINEEVKQMLFNNLSPEQMKNLDDCYRSNLEGQRIMIKALKRALNKIDENQT